MPVKRKTNKKFDFWETEHFVLPLVECNWQQHPKASPQLDWRLSELKQYGKTSSALQQSAYNLHKVPANWMRAHVMDIILFTLFAYAFRGNRGSQKDANSGDLRINRDWWECYFMHVSTDSLVTAAFDPKFWLRRYTWEFGFGVCMRNVANSFLHLILLALLFVNSLSMDPQQWSGSILLV